jgi:hypothetical protein
MGIQDVLMRKARARTNAAEAPWDID